jgi:uncharacterized protein YPO0396
LQNQAISFQKIQQIDYDSIDVPGAKSQLDALRERLENLIRPDSDASVAKAKLDEAQTVESELDKQLRAANKVTNGLDTELTSARAAERKAQQTAQKGMQDEERELCASHFPAGLWFNCPTFAIWNVNMSGEFNKKLRALKVNCID